MGDTVIGTAGDGLRDRLRSWLDASDVLVEGRPDHGGYSNVTVFVRVDGQHLVLRLEPAESGLMPTYDLGEQVACMTHLAHHGLPVPRIVHQDLHGEIFGRPAFLMEMITGRVPSDGAPNFVRHGFVRNAEPNQQRTFVEDLVGRIAQLHRTPVPETRRLAGPDPAAHVEWCEKTADMWGRGDAWFESTAAILKASAPGDPKHVSLLWGDARPANTVVDDGFRVVGMLDWEMAGLGAGELDIAWMLEMNRMRAGGDIRQFLPGFPTEAEIWDLWAEEVGRRPESIGWYVQLAAFRSAVLLESHLHVLASTEQFPMSHPLWEDNRARRRTEQLLSEQPWTR